MTASALDDDAVVGNGRVRFLKLVDEGGVQQRVAVFHVDMRRGFGVLVQDLTKPEILLPGWHQRVDVNVGIKFGKVIL